MVLFWLFFLKMLSIVNAASQCLSEGRGGQGKGMEGRGGGRKGERKGEEMGKGSRERERKVKCFAFLTCVSK